MSLVLLGNRVSWVLQERMERLVNRGNRVSKERRVILVKKVILDKEDSRGRLGKQGKQGRQENLVKQVIQEMMVHLVKKVYRVRRVQQESMAQLVKLAILDKMGSEEKPVKRESLVNVVIRVIQEKKEPLANRVLSVQLALREKSDTLESRV